MIHSQIKDPEKVIRLLARDYLKRMKKSSGKKWKKFLLLKEYRQMWKKATGDAIREYALAGVKVDEDYKRYYPLDPCFKSAGIYRR